MPNLEILSAVHGIAPRSDDLLQLGGDVERGRANQSEYEELLATEETNWLQFQEAEGIDLRENGKLRWQDHLRPIVKATGGFVEGIDEAPVTRWFETNTFYRRPTIVGNLVFNPERFEAEAGPLGNYISLIAPDSLADLSDNRSPIDPQANVRQLYESIFTHLQNRHVRDVLLEEYPLEDEYLAAAYETAGHTAILARDYPGIRLGLIRHGAGLKDRFSTDLRDKFVLTTWEQAIDADSTAADVLDVSDWAPDKSDKSSQPARLVLTHTVDLERVPLPYAMEKVKRLGELTRQVRKQAKEK